MNGGYPIVNPNVTTGLGGPAPPALPSVFPIARPSAWVYDFNPQTRKARASFKGEVQGEIPGPPGGGSQITVGPTAPDNPNVGDGWYDTSGVVANNKTRAFNIWDGTKWQAANAVAVIYPSPVPPFTIAPTDNVADGEIVFDWGRLWVAFQGYYYPMATPPQVYGVTTASGWAGQGARLIDAFDWNYGFNAGGAGGSAVDGVTRTDLSRPLGAWVTAVWGAFTEDTWPEGGGGVYASYGRGDLWFKPTSGTLDVHDGTQWRKIVAAFINDEDWDLAVPGVPPRPGQMQFKPTFGELSVFDGTRWRIIATGVP